VLSRATFVLHRHDCSSGPPAVFESNGYFACTRAVEVLPLQASPILGISVGNYSLEASGVIQPIPFTLLGLLFGSLSLTVHIFFINDLAGQCTDIHDPRRTKQVFTERGISKLQVSYVATAPLILAYVAFAAVGGPALLLGAAFTTGRGYSRKGVMIDLKSIYARRHNLYDVEAEIRACIA
jgi:4-hydroxybenzoate polyprenyltransferase